MMRKLLIVVLCGFVQQSACSRMRFEQTFHEPIYRHDPQMHGEPVYKREHFFPREPIPTDQILPQQNIMRAEPIYGGDRIMANPQPQQRVIPNEEFLPSEQIIQNEPMLQNEQFIRSEPILRREPFFRREPILRRESFLRNEPIIRGGRMYQNAAILQDGGMFRNEPNAYTVMVSPCSCQETQNVPQRGPQEAFFQIPQAIQTLQQQPILTHRLIFQKPVIKQQAYQPIVQFPRLQRFLRKSFKPLAENIQFSAPSLQTAPAQEFNSFNSEPVPFANFQNQGQQSENTSEPNQVNPVTVRNVPQISNPLTLAQMSSIC